MQKLRLAHGVSAKQVAQEFGCSPSHISRVEQGTTRPSQELVQFYERRFEGDGMLYSIDVVAVHAAEQERRRAGGKRPLLYRAIPGDASTFVDDTIANGTMMRPGKSFEKIWRIKNSGNVPWEGRRLERQGPIQGPGLISSPRYVAVPDTAAGELAEIQASLKAPTYDCTSIAYFKMVDADGRLCFPDNYQLGLEVLVRVEGQMADVTIS